MSGRYFQLNPLNIKPYSCEEWGISLGGMAINLTSWRSRRGVHRNWHRLGCSESWRRPRGSWVMFGSRSAGPRWHQTEERWTGPSFYSASGWSEVWRTWSLNGNKGRRGSELRVQHLFMVQKQTVGVLTYHHLSQSDQRRTGTGRSCDERTSCCSGYSRQCCCHLLDRQKHWNTPRQKSTFQVPRVFADRRVAPSAHKTRSPAALYIQHQLIGRARETVAVIALLFILLFTLCF